MPLPNPTLPGHCDFALINLKQKKRVDKFFFNNGKGRSCHPKQFRQWLESLSFKTSGERFVSVFSLDCGGQYLEKSCVNFVVSAVGRHDLNSHSLKNAYEVDDHTRLEVHDRNKLDVEYIGTVLFRFHPSPKCDILSNDMVDLLRKTYHT